jgi:hypothetical protein
VDPNAFGDGAESREILPLPGLELRPLGRPACSQEVGTKILSMQMKFMLRN